MYFSRLQAFDASSAAHSGCAEFGRDPSRCPPAEQDYPNEPQGQGPGHGPIAKAGDVPGAGRRGVHRLEVDAVIHGRIRRRFRAAGRRGSGHEGVVQGAAAARRDRGEEGGVDLAAPGGAGTGTTGGAAAGVPFEIFNDNGRGRAVARRERRRRVLVLPKGREGVLLRNAGGNVGRRRGPLHAEEDGHDHHLLHPQVHTEQMRHDPEDGDEEELHQP